ncbi:hypothetical protein, partial [Sulfitobacter sp. DFL-23]|uniref:hypothetical protein n=1 Tax=Sulfitobacter sp. DFL-23 TaxID=215829 RepID=UPI0019661E52
VLELLHGCRICRRLKAGRFRALVHASVVRAAANLKDDQAGLLLGHERGELLSRELFAKLDLPRPQGAVYLENTLCQIDSDHHILHLAVLLFAWR